MKQHFVEFFSPGTFVAESSQKPIENWNVDDAVKMARSIIERYNATPYGFQFVTRERGKSDLDSKEVARSAMFFLGGETFTVEQIAARNDPSEKILLSNMRCNKWDKVVINNNSWQWTQPLGNGDVVLDFPAPVSLARKPKE